MIEGHQLQKDIRNCKKKSYSRLVLQSSIAV